MVVQYEKRSKKRIILLSLFFHLCLLTGLFLMDNQLHHQKQQLSVVLTEEKDQTTTPRLTPAQKQALAQQKQNATQQQLQQPSVQPKKEKSKQPLDQRPFNVPAPVVFYGNQVMLNKPVPIKGHKEGKAAFEYEPSALPSPTQGNAGKQESSPSESHKKSLATDHPLGSEKTTPPVLSQATTPAIQEPTLASTVAVIQEALAAVLPQAQEASADKQQQPSTTAESKTEAQNSLPAASFAKTTASAEEKPLTLATLFKNAGTDLQTFAQPGISAFKKAGTEDGDEQGSGHQVTIREGDMKYYTLWAKFLNHLNQAARFNHRGKERLVHGWIQSEQLRYILQCAITVDKQGKLLDVEILHSSGCRGFDELCLSDIRYAVPYPPLPESLGKKIARFEVSVHP